MQDNAQLFRAMADRIDRNDSAEFGGAVLIVPPQGGEPIAVLIVDPKQDLAAFWGTVEAHVARVRAELEERQRQPFGMR